MFLCSTANDFILLSDYFIVLNFFILLLWFCSTLKLLICFYFHFHFACCSRLFFLGSIFAIKDICYGFKLPLTFIAGFCVLIYLLFKISFGFFANKEITNSIVKFVCGHLYSVLWKTATPAGTSVTCSAGSPFSSLLAAPFGLNEEIWVFFHYFSFKKVSIKLPSETFC